VTKPVKNAAEGAAAVVTKLKKPGGLGAAGTVLGVLGGLAIGGVVCAAALLAWKHRDAIRAALSSGGSPATHAATVTQLKKA
jgi:hypothetical protein